MLILSSLNTVAVEKGKYELEKGLNDQVCIGRKRKREVVLVF
jgi:hypothetical protein